MVGEAIPHAQTENDEAQYGNAHDTLIDQLIEDDDDELMSETREIIFKKAISKYACLTRQATGMQFDSSKIEMKQRKGDHKLQSYAKDSVNLFLYYVELISEFPRGIVKGDMTYLDIQPVFSEQLACEKPTQPKIQACFDNMAKSKETVNVKNDVIVNPVGAQNTCRCPQFADLLADYKTALIDKDREISNLRAHVLSIEKILFDEIVSVRSISEANSKKIQHINISADMYGSRAKLVHHQPDYWCCGGRRHCQSCNC